MNLLANMRALQQAQTATYLPTGGIAGGPTAPPPPEVQVRIHNSPAIWQLGQPMLAPYNMDGSPAPTEGLIPSLNQVHGLLVEHPAGGSPRLPNRDPRPYIVICSVYPAPLASEPFHQIHSIPRFFFEAVPRGQFRSMRIYQSKTVQRDLTIEDEAHGIFDTDMRALGNDIIRHVAQGMPGSREGTCQPGVMMLPGDVPTWEEFQLMRAMQLEWFRARVKEADGWHAKAEAGLKPEGMVSRWHHEALEALGDFDPSRHRWYQEIKETALKQCMACGRSMPAVAAVHSPSTGGCGQNLLAFYRESMFSADEVKVIDPVLAPRYESILQRLAATYGQGAGPAAVGQPI